MALLHDALAPLRSNPAGTAILMDIDGTLSPIVEHADEATVPESTRQLLILASRRYRLVACVSGRRASAARAMVSIGTITYLGAHGAELLRAGWTDSKLDPELARWIEPLSEFARRQDPGELRRARIRIEDKGVIVAFHWRGAEDESVAKTKLEQLSEQARQTGFEVHWGRKVLEVRPPVRFDKGDGITSLIRQAGVRAALYAGDDLTDLDAFHALASLSEAGELDYGLRVAVHSQDGPAELELAADLVVEETEGFHRLLASLVAE